MTTAASSTRPPLVRPREVSVGGVSAALAVHLGVRAGGVRAAFVLLTFAGGAGALLYGWLWALVPLQPLAADQPFGVHRRVPVVVGVGVIACFAAVIVCDQLLRGQGAGATPVLLVFAIVAAAAVFWNLVFDRTDPQRSQAYRTVPRIAIAALLLITGAVALISRPGTANTVIAVGLIVLGIGVIAVPRVVSLWTELMTERTARVRDVQRAEIAAHLHDSVLQTLALIQNRAGASSEVARIARAQERELRDWLFAGEDPATMDLATQLRDTAAAIELDHAVRIDIVTTGEPVEAAAPIIAAAREAMLNAARHAGGDVSVYLETSSSAIDVFVRDRGPGVLLDDIPADRLGIRESIIGRMARAGGSVTMRPGAGGSGTEVHLHLEVTP
jgi:signal transduction histidine kinase